MEPLGIFGLMAAAKKRVGWTVPQNTLNSTEAIQPGRAINYSWTADNDHKIVHSRLIGHGGSGQVHEVLCLITVPDA
jgi:hypothetical protein